MDGCACATIRALFHFTFLVTYNHLTAICEMLKEPISSMRHYDAVRYTCSLLHTLNEDAPSKRVIVTLLCDVITCSPSVSVSLSETITVTYFRTIDERLAQCTLEPGLNYTSARADARLFWQHLTQLRPEPPTSECDLEQRKGFSKLLRETKKMVNIDNGKAYLLLYSLLKL